MSDGPEWFAPKRFGYGAGRPISWQGWILSIAFVAAVGFATLELRHSMIAFVSIVASLSAAFFVITARTTRGGLRWRWGEKD
jgi:hypothetical protein